MSYAERRALAIKMAADYSGKGRPPVPESGKMIGRVLHYRVLHRGAWIGPGRVNIDPLLEILFQARERRQDRHHFSKDD